MVSSSGSEKSTNGIESSMIYTTLRMIHILLGMFFVCSMLFIFLILWPAMRRARLPAAPVKRAIPALMVPIMASSLIGVISTGMVMTLMLQGGSLSSLLRTAWGWSVFVSFLATLSIVVSISIVAPAGLRMARLDRLTRGRTPTSEEIEELNSLTRRFYSVADTKAMYVASFIALAAMLILRYL